MSLKYKLFRHFFPAVISFLILSYISTFPKIQAIYFPVFEKISELAIKNNHPDLYVKTKKGGSQFSNNPNEVFLLFNSKAYLSSLLKKSKKTGQKIGYDYKGFIIFISETFVTPLIFFFSLLLITPNKWYKNLTHFLIGSLLIIAFAYITVHFRGLAIISESGISSFPYQSKEIEFYKLLSYFFSSVTIVSFSLLIWLSLALNFKT